MSVELININHQRRVLNPGDRGFLVVSKVRWHRNLASDTIKWLKSYAQKYMEEKCLEQQSKSPPEDEEDQQDDDTASMEENAEHSDIKEEKDEQCLEAESRNESKKKDSEIVFLQRDLLYDNCVFIASNLADPGEYLHFVLQDMALSKQRTKIPLRVMPVQGTCEARLRQIERTVTPLLKKTVGKGEEPYRFSMIYRGKMDLDHMTQQQIGAIVRNCLWSVNPNCVQCIKFQDYAIMIEVLNPIVCIGIAKDFNKLWAYNTSAIRHGIDMTDMDEDSEDDISDDPNLDEEDEKKRKLRIKRKRRAEKAGFSQEAKEAKRSQEDNDLEDDDDEGEEEDEEQNEMNPEEQLENGAE